MVNIKYLTLSPGGILYNIGKHKVFNNANITYRDLLLVNNANITRRHKLLNKDKA